MIKKMIAVLGLVSLLMMSSLAAAGEFTGKKVLFIDSYHQGYPWSDGIQAGVERTLKDSGVDLKVIHMDTKRNKGDAFMNEAAIKAKAVIESFKPDVVIAGDDNASKYLIQPFYKDAALPFVFCGVNWDATNYGYPYKNVTGMVEVAGAKELVGILQTQAGGAKVGLLADNTLSSKTDADNYKSKLGLDVTPVLASSFEAWKKAFKDIQGQYDIMLVGNYAGINDFDIAQAESFALEHAKIPSGAVQRSLMPFVVLGYLKMPEEQGDWAAATALKILGGATAGDIAIVKNEKGIIVVNAKIMGATGVELPYEIIESAEQVIE